MIRGALGAIVAALLLSIAVTTLVDVASHPKPAALNYWQDDAVVDRLIVLAKDLASDPSPPRQDEILDDLVALHRRAPLERRVLYVLVDLLERTGRHSAADRLIEIVGGMGYRDPGFRTVYTVRLLKSGRWQEAVDSYDALLRIFVDARPALLTDLANTASIDAFRGVLLTKLATRPPWRRVFLSYLRDLYSSKTFYFETYDALNADQSDPDLQEFSDYLKGRIDAGDTALAHEAWVNFNRRRGVAVPYGVFDGAFTLPADGIPFGWANGEVKNVVHHYLPHPTMEGRRALGLTFFGDRTPYIGVEQWLALQPGHHTFKAQSTAEELTAGRGLVWRFFCRQQGGTWLPLATTRPDQGSHGWMVFEVDFDVPEIDCPLQTLRLEPGGHAVLDTEISGSVTFTDLEIRKR